MARQFRTPIQFDTGDPGATITNADGTRAVLWGSGSPESSVTASVGAVYLRTDGGATTTLYIKESGTGNTGWVAMGSASFPLEQTATAGTDETLTTEVTADANKRFILTADGIIGWGDGTATQDTNLYRGGANTLTTDDTLMIGGSLAVTEAGGKDTVELTSTSADTGLTIGADTNLYRSAANTLSSDDVFVADNIKRGTGDPEAAVTGAVGDVYQRTDGGTATTFYVKETGTGNTGWAAVGAGGGGGLDEGLYWMGGIT